MKFFGRGGRTLPTEKSPNPVKSFESSNNQIVFAFFVGCRFRTEVVFTFQAAPELRLHDIVSKIKAEEQRLAREAAERKARWEADFARAHARAPQPSIPPVSAWSPSCPEGWALGGADSNGTCYRWLPLAGAAGDVQGAPGVCGCLEGCPARLAVVTRPASPRVATATGRAAATNAKQTATDAKGTATDAEGTATDAKGTATDAKGTAADAKGAAEAEAVMLAIIPETVFDLALGGSSAWHWALLPPGPTLPWCRPGAESPCVTPGTGDAPAPRAATPGFVCQCSADPCWKVRDDVAVMGYADGGTHYPSLLEAKQRYAVVLLRCAFAAVAGPAAIAKRLPRGSGDLHYLFGAGVNTRVT